jgi:hypothetical protein
MQLNSSRGCIQAVAACLVVFSLWMTAGQVQAGGITIGGNEAVPKFPDNITFHIKAGADAKIDKVTLIYGVNAGICIEGQARHEMIFDPANTIDLEWAWDLFRGRDLPPGVEIWWQWQVHAVDGEETTTMKRQLVVEDPNYRWNSISQGQISLFWADGSNAFANSLLDIAVKGLDRLAKTSNLVPAGNIRLTFYPTPDELIAALNHTTDWMGGVAFAEYHIVLIAANPTSDQAWVKDVIPHELAHLVFDQRTANCLGTYPPLWLNEGYAMYAEGPVTSEDSDPVIQELKNGTLQPFTSLANGFPANSKQANLAYWQSKLMVDFLIQTYGIEKFEALLDQFKDGEKTNDALRAIYGLDTGGLDATWRASLGFGTAPAQDYATPTKRPSPTAVPTVALISPLKRSTATPPPTAIPTESISTPAPTSGPATALSGEQVTPAPVSPQAANPRVPATVFIAGGVLVILILAGGAGYALLKKKQM